MITIKSKREIELMKEVCKLTAQTYDYIESIIKPGMTTWELDKLAEEFIRSHGGIPAEKGYPSGVKGVPNFPASLCVSINDVVIHGVPSKDVIITAKNNNYSRIRYTIDGSEPTATTGLTIPNGGTFVIDIPETEPVGFKWLAVNPQYANVK